MGLIDQKQLEEMCREGRFKKAPTFVVETLECDDPASVRVILADKPNGRELGTCFAEDISEVLSSAVEPHEEKTNPNLSVLKWAFNEAKRFSGVAEATFKREVDFHANKVVSIFTREPV